MISLLHRFAALGLLVAALSSHAADIADQRFNDKLRLAGSELVLNGVGVRAVLWLKGYAVGLYVAERAATPERLLLQAGPKRIELRMLIEVEAKEFTKAIESGLSKNYSDADRAPLRDREAQFSGQVARLDKLRKGDVIYLDHLPGVGLVLSRNGTQAGPPVRGDDFFKAILKIFVGERPVDKALKRGLLGAAPE